MARQFSAAPSTEPVPPAQSHDWQALRGELVALLDQVEGRYVQKGSTDPAFAGFAQRMRDLRYKVSDNDPEDRQRQALQTVKRQVDRFTERGEPDISARPDIALQSAIQEIRARTRPAPAARANETAAAASPAEVPVPPAEAAMPAAAIRIPGPPPPRFDELASAMTSLTGRLGQLESELSSQRGNAGQVKEIATQVEQLSHVVELLAGAVGETGQVKRLEAQIAGLAQLIGEGQKVDLTQLTERLDQVSATVDRLADLQVQQIQHAVREAEAAPHKDAESQRGLNSIESSVRNIYDRLDALENNVALPAGELEKISGLLAEIGTRMGGEAGRPDRLLGLVDALHGRVNEIEDRQDGASALKAEVEQLRGAIVTAIEPRFAALETQLGALGDKLDAGPGEIAGIGQLEAQIRQLVARMDQTSEQLSEIANLGARTQAQLAQAPDLAELADAAARRAAEMMLAAAPAAPDFEALADLVASRTSESISGLAVAAPAAPALSTDTLDEIEARISRLVEGIMRAQPPDGAEIMQSGIERVEDRLGSLETSVREGLRRDAAQEIAARLKPAVEPTPAIAAEAAPMPVPEAAKPAAGRSNDTMPRDPAVEAPLRDEGFGEQGPVQAALAAKNGPRRPMAWAEELPQTRAELASGTEALASADALPSPSAGFDPANVTPPPRPRSSFDTAATSLFAEPEPAVSEAAAPAPVAANSRNTFIEAARRAAQRQQGGGGAHESAIGRALARFQTGASKAAPEDAVEPMAPTLVADQPPVVEKKRRRPFARQKDAPVVIEPALAMPVELAAVPLDDEAEEHALKRESFLVRYRRPILIGASLIAVSFLALNLVMQRLTPQGDSHPAPMPSATAPAVPKPAAFMPDAAPAATLKPASLTMPMAIPHAETPPAAPAPSASVAAPSATDPITTASISPEAMMNAASAGHADAAEAMPAAVPAGAGDAAVGTPSTTGPAPTVASIGDPASASSSLESPVKVELPPDNVGPQPLRQAAADGDARAQFEVAAIYSEGRAIPQDLKQAAVWYERAAAQGFAPAQYRLGNLYETGKGMDKDLEQARLWYQRAAEAGNRMAMHNLAALYAGGQFGKQDFTQAANWFEQAADRDMKDSQFNLGMLYARGLGVKQDLETSYKWFSLAAATGDGEAVKSRDNVARSLDAEAIKRAQAAIAAWKPVQIDLAANFAPIGTWQKDFSPGPAITSKDVVLKVQQALRRLGYDVGTPDGHVGPKTTQAIKTFEQGTGMTQVGAVNPRLLAVLGSQPV